MNNNALTEKLKNFWQNEYIVDVLTPTERYLYLYLLTNSDAVTNGKYKFRGKVMAFETGYAEVTIMHAMNDFVRKGMISYDPDTKIVKLNLLEE